MPPPEPTHKHLKKHIGSSIDEPCYLPRNNVLYVKIYNPQNELVQEGSSGLSTHLVIKSLKQEHNGTWKCAIQLKGRIMEVHNNIIVEGKRNFKASIKLILLPPLLQFHVAPKVLLAASFDQVLKNLFQYCLMRRVIF